jgi:ribulose 1,5-bisphosphate carboxylase large subunit-like protein
MDIQSIIATTTAIGAGAGGYFGGRLTGKSSASQVAADTVDMLQTQVDLLKDDKNSKDSELNHLRSRVEVLESLVTQRAEVAELSTNISFVKETVERIATKVGA